MTVVVVLFEKKENEMRNKTIRLQTRCNSCGVIVPRGSVAGVWSVFENKEDLVRPSFMFAVCASCRGQFENPVLTFDEGVGWGLAEGQQWVARLTKEGLVEASFVLALHSIALE